MLSFVHFRTLRILRVYVYVHIIINQLHHILALYTVHFTHIQQCTEHGHVYGDVIKKNQNPHTEPNYKLKFTSIGRFS